MTRHKLDIEIEDVMIRIRKNYLGDLAMIVWKAFKVKFSEEEIIKIVNQGNNILIYVILYTEY